MKRKAQMMFRYEKVQERFQWPIRVSNVASAGVDGFPRLPEPSQTGRANSASLATLILPIAKYIKRLLYLIPLSSGVLRVCNIYKCGKALGFYRF